MRSLIICVAVALLFGASLGTSQLERNAKLLRALETFVYEDKINATIEGLKEQMMTGNETAGIPSFNPLELAEVYLNLSEAGLLTTDMLLNNVVVSGIPMFTATYLKFNMIGGFAMDLSVAWSADIRATASYSGEAELLGFVPIYGTGDFDINISGLDVSASFKIGTVDGLVSIDNLTLALNVNNLAFDMKGLLNDPDASLLLSAVLSDVSTDVVRHRSDWVTQTFSPIASVIVNQMVDGMTVDELVDMLLGG